MDNTEIRKKLMEAKKGCLIVVGGLAQEVVEVVDYKLHTASWRDLVCQRGDENIVVEVADGDKISIWREIDDLEKSIALQDAAIAFQGETLVLEELGRPDVMVDGNDEGKVVYAIFVGESGAVVCGEDWPDDDLRIYHLEKEVSLSKIDVIPS